MTDVTYRFKVWFEWGFIYNCVTFLQVCTAFMESIIDDQSTKEAISKLTSVSTVILGLASLCHTVTGAIFRWSHSGKVCSGDYLADELVETYGQFPPYQFKSGKFMKIYLVLLLTLWGLAFCCMCLCGCCMAATRT